VGPNDSTPVDIRVFYSLLSADQILGYWPILFVRNLIATLIHCDV